MTELPGGRITIPDGVVRRSFGDDKVLLNLSTGQYHGLNPTAGLMLDLLDQTGDAAATARQVADDLGVDLEVVRSDLATLCRELEQRGLVVIG